MDQLIAQITQRTGISEDQARQAVEMVVGLLKDRLPAPLAAQIDSLLNGGSLQDIGPQALNTLGGLFDHK